MYAVHPIPLSEIKAITKRTPKLGWHYLCIIRVNGLTLPPLYFNNGGVRAFISVLKEVRHFARLLRLFRAPPPRGKYALGGLTLPYYHHPLPPQPLLSVFPMQI
jgi:hypothetical protein